ncbi:MAG: hypothetical protein WCF24_08160 [Acidimicrobiales bacterium]
MEAHGLTGEVLVMLSKRLVVAAIVLLIVGGLTTVFALKRR